jgi:hypothetical protein
MDVSEADVPVGCRTHSVSEAPRRKISPPSPATHTFSESTALTPRNSPVYGYGPNGRYSYQVAESDVYAIITVAVGE